MKKRSLTPAIRRLLAHAIECGGAWLASDPVRVYRAAVLAAERRGLVTVEREHGAIDSAIVTTRGRAEMGWFPPSKGAGA